jgi:hypothetical protein
MLALLAMLTQPVDAAPFYVDSDRQFNSTIQKVESMVWDDNVVRLANRNGLDVVNVSWEDTARYEGSSVGPNISDMTIGVRDATGALHPMPVLRFDNFSDKTADVRADELWLRVGNERGAELHPVTLEHLLKNTREYLTDGSSWRGKESGLWDSRDSHVIVSAQAAFLPIPKNGNATFTPVVYNYQSSQGNPAVATIVATREGSSIQIVDNASGYMSDVQYFNQNGSRAPFTATRISDFKAKGGDATTPASQVTDDAGLNVVLVVQIPLEHRQMVRGFDDYEEFDMAPMAEAAGASMKRSSKSDVENAVIGHGPIEGDFEEFAGLALERDKRFPVRVTVQFYKATSNGVVSADDVREVREQIDKVYASGDYVGSLVTDGHTGRPTEWTAPPARDAVWARPWWSWHTAN